MVAGIGVGAMQVLVLVQLPTFVRLKRRQVEVGLKAKTSEWHHAGYLKPHLLFFFSGTVFLGRLTISGKGRLGSYGGGACPPDFRNRTINHLVPLALG